MTDWDAIRAGAEALPALYLGGLTGITALLWVLMASAVSRAIEQQDRNFWIVAGILSFLSYFPLSLVAMAAGLI